ncbi:hypothetical protein V498_01456 [Pseudogymnoascus sp. VKM F-4517 (FW-2822)]|nr:hypothetical protein V498_01456 [Pseudogymnoascus sp. VKM F-4517 (FW-2822)]
MAASSNTASTSMTSSGIASLADDIATATPSTLERVDSNHQFEDSKKSRKRAHSSFDDVKGWRKFRVLRPFRGITHDICHRLPYYWSDITDAFTYRTAASTVRMYFVNILPALAYTLDMNRRTDGFYGVNESLFSSALAAMVLSTISAQPLTIVSPAKRLTSGIRWQRFGIFVTTCDMLQVSPAKRLTIKGAEELVALFDHYGSVDGVQAKDWGGVSLQPPTMRFTRPSPLATFIALLSFIACTASAERLLSSTSLSECIENSNFTAKLFNVAFTPSNNSINFEVDGTSTLTGKFTLMVEVAAYGYVILKTPIDPCQTEELLGLCTMQPGPMPFSTHYEVSPDVVKNIPFIAYTIPDLDATVKIQFVSKTNPDLVEACVEAQLSNGKTVDQNGVSWGTAGVAGLALLVSAVIAGLGHSNTAAHIAAYALSLFSYFQAVAIVGMTAVPLPPIVQSWTQNFQWTMGVIGVGFMQDIASWYQKSTGGTPATILNTLTTTSVHVMRRSLASAAEANSVGISVLKRAATNKNIINPITGTYTVRGIDRVAFRSSMESTNLFLTGLMFFCFFLAATTIGVVAFKGFCELAVKSKWMKSDKFEDFRLGWKLVLKGIMYRMVLIGYPQMTILCLWEFTKVDSPAEVTLAVIFFFGMTAILAWAASKVVLIGRRSKAMHKNPAYMLYSDPTSLNRWGFLYIQFRATAYYYIIPTLVYILIKGMFVALGQRSGTAQAIGLLIIEGGVLAAASVLKPWMDKSTNTVNISICSINVFNAICLIFYSDIFGQPALATGVIGVAFFVVNAVFAFVLLILVIVSTILAATRKNPDTRYQTMSDDRASFIKSQTALSTELDALGATARGEMKGGFKHGLDLDDDSWESESMRRHPANMALPPSTANSHDAPAFASDRGSGSPFDEKRGVYQGSFAAESRPNSDISLASGARMGPSPTPQFMGRNGARGSRTSLASQQGYVRANNASPLGTRDQNTPSPWQRGAGYDH